MDTPVTKALKSSFPLSKIDAVARLNSGNRKVFSIRGINKDREAAFKQIQDVLKSNGIEHEVQELKSISKNFPYVISYKHNGIVYQYTTKPDIAGRVSSGSIAQDKVANFVKLFGAKNEDVKTAKIGSQDIDVSFKLNGVTETAEVKNSSNLNSINVFDITVYRQGKQSAASKDLTFVNDLIQDFTGYPSLEAYVDYLRQSDTTIGYCGDEGVKNKSGNLPTRYFRFTDRLDKAAATLVSHWYKDDYFIIVGPDKFTIFNTKKPGMLSSLIQKYTGTTIETFNKTHLTSITFSTYGGTRPGTIRMQLSVNLTGATSIKYDQTLVDKININI